jgi:hypothetical protein
MEFSDSMLLKILKIMSWLIALGLVIVTIVPADERPVTGLSHNFEHSLAFGLAGITLRLLTPDNHERSYWVQSFTPLCWN